MTTQDNRARIEIQQIAIDDLTARVEELWVNDAELRARLDGQDKELVALRTHVDTLVATWEGMQERAGDRLRERIARLDIDQRDGLKQIVRQLDELIDEVRAVKSAARKS